MNIIDITVCSLFAAIFITVICLLIYYVRREDRMLTRAIARAATALRARADTIEYDLIPKAHGNLLSVLRIALAKDRKAIEDLNKYYK